MTAKPRNTKKFRLDPAHPPALTPAQAERLKATPIDYSDIPELPDDFWADNPPVEREPKEQITLRLDAGVVKFFRSMGERYQTRINAVLRSFVDAEQRRREGRKNGVLYQGPVRQAAKALKPAKGGKGRTGRSRGRR